MPLHKPLTTAVPYQQHRKPVCDNNAGHATKTCDKKPGKYIFHGSLMLCKGKQPFGSLPGVMHKALEGKPM